MSNQNEFSSSTEEALSDASSSSSSLSSSPSSSFNSSTSSPTTIISSKSPTVRRLSGESQHHQPQDEGLWVFGYGSLVWNPGFKYSESRVGYIKGYKRRFWQGNDCQRGTPDQMGRVVTLIEDEESVTWGKAFQLVDEASARMYLDHRESNLGGYTTIITSFHSRDSRDPAIPVLVYVALPSNPLYTGDEPLESIAVHIARSQGSCGHNIEYLAKLAAFMRLNVPNVHDDHLFKLESLVQSTLKQSNQSQLVKLFDDAFREILTISNESTSICGQNHHHGDLIEVDHNGQLVEGYYADELAEPPRRFVDTVPTRKLRCLNI